MPLYKDQDRTYHGIQQYESAHDDQEWQPARLQVEQAEFGPTGHKDVTVLRRFDVPEDSGSGWGYNGGGTSHTAAAILADALDVDDDWFGVSGDPDLRKLSSGRPLTSYIAQAELCKSRLTRLTTCRRSVQHVGPSSRLHT
ncbi:MAG: hypothetical protein M3R63_09110, partial [Actinomycetota bacterium]|nr:hypothetical protein [Actinomycetota bacterium]